VIQSNSSPAGETAVVNLVSVNVALPALLGYVRGQPVLSAIGKRPVTVETLTLDTFNLEGDRQADLSVHGGVDKAVYAYPSEHLPSWNGELGAEPPFGPGTFGENLTTAGLREDEVRIGDRWTWGEAVLEVAQPRYPCFKLARTTNRPDLPKRLIATGRCGWYLRVLSPGAVPVAGPLRVIERHPADVTVADAFRAMLPGAPLELMERVAAVEPLAASWRGPILRELGSPAAD
jgi:MOSC domain-containing protein YiiM